VENIVRIPIPEWAYTVSLNICLARQRRYRHQFITKKLKDIAGNDELLKKDIEGVYGYLGDICSCIWLGLDPKEEMRSMLIDTDLLTHRDEYDVLYKGWRTDIKTEIYPNENFERAIRKQLEMKETYGCRLININHILENSANIDVYLFATIDNQDPRLAKHWIPIGWVYKDDVLKICPEPKGYSPSGARLWTKAYIIPNAQLRDLNDFRTLANKPGPQGLFRSTSGRNAAIDQNAYNDLITKVGLD
jgi:hypothetical protein